MTERKFASSPDLGGKRLKSLGAPVAADDGARKSDVDTAYNNARSRTNHTGSQTASTISDFDTQVRTSRLDQLSAPTNPINVGTQRLTAVGDPVDAQDVVTKNFLDQALSGLTSGQITKGAVVVSVGTNVDLLNPGATLDGVTLTANDKVLLFGQTSGAENGPYVWNGPAVGMTRSPNWDSQADAQLGSYWIVLKGTRADNLALMTNDTFVFGTDTMQVVHISATPSETVPLEVDLGNGSGTSFTLTHSFGTKAVHVKVLRNASPYDELTVAVEYPDNDTVIIKPDDVWTTNEVHAIVWR